MSSFLKDCLFGGKPFGNPRWFSSHVRATWQPWVWLPAVCDVDPNLFEEIRRSRPSYGDRRLDLLPLEVKLWIVQAAKRRAEADAWDRAMDVIRRKCSQRPKRRRKRKPGPSKRQQVVDARRAARKLERERKLGLR